MRAIKVIPTKSVVLHKQSTLNIGIIMQDKFGLYIRTNSGAVNLATGQFYSDADYADTAYTIVPFGDTIEITV